MIKKSKRHAWTADRPLATHATQPVGIFLNRFGNLPRQSFAPLAGVGGLGYPGIAIPS